MWPVIYPSRDRRAASSRWGQKIGAFLFVSGAKPNSSQKQQSYVDVRLACKSLNVMYQRTACRNVHLKALWKHKRFSFCVCNVALHCIIIRAVATEAVSVKAEAVGLLNYETEVNGGGGVSRQKQGRWGKAICLEVRIELESVARGLRQSSDCSFPLVLLRDRQQRVVQRSKNTEVTAVVQWSKTARAHCCSEQVAETVLVLGLHAQLRCPPALLAGE